MRWTLHAVLASLVIVSALNGGQERMRRPSNTGVPATASPLVISLLQKSHDLAGQLPVSARLFLLTRQTQIVSRFRSDLAREWADELFTLSFQASGDQRALAQDNAMGVLARLDPDRALEMLHSMSPEEPDGAMTTRQLQLAQHLFGVLAERDGAGVLPMLEEEARLMGARGTYPYGALGVAATQATLKYWGKDNQYAFQVEQSVFGSAFTRYTQTPHGFLDDLEFGTMLEFLAGGLPFESVQPALRLLVKNLLAADARKYEFQAEVYTSDGKTARADNAIDAALLSFGMLINRDPELAQQLQSTRPELRTALEYAKSERQIGMATGKSVPPMDRAEELQTKALSLSHNDPEAAISTAEQLPDDEQGANIMLQVARDIAADHPERASEVIAETQHRNNSSDDQTQLNVLATQAFLAAAQHRDQDLQQLLRRGFDAASPLFLEPRGMDDKRLPAGLMPLVQVGIQNDPELTATFIEGLPSPYLKASLYLGAASALNAKALPSLASRPR
jgi:hypothetical protein